MWFHWRNPAFVVLVLGLGAIRPIITPNQVPITTDFTFHLYRLVALETLFADGIFFSRWIPQFVYGYGYPLFNFVPPLPYYLALPFTLLVDQFLAIQLLTASGILFGGWSTYRFLSNHVRPTSAIVGAVGLMYAPYTAYDALHRSNLAELLGLVIVPCLLWRLDCYLRSRSPSSLLGVSVSIAALTLTHNLVALMALPLAGLYGVVAIWREKSAEKHQHLLQLTLSFAYGLALSAFFWLPAILETSLVAIERLNPSAEFTVTNNFLNLSELFSLPILYPNNLINPAPPPAIGLIPLIICLLLWRKSAAWRIHFFGFGLLIILCLTLPYSTMIWEAVPTLELFQFPWRWLALGVTLVAFTLGLAAQSMPRPFSLLLILLLIWQGQGWVDLPHIPTFEANIAGMTQIEQATGTLGTTTTGEYVPSTVRFLPDEPATALFVGTGISEKAAQTGRWRVRQTAHVMHSAEQTIIAQQFAFPGWHATVDGDRVPITPSERHGLITFRVPAGDHQVQIEFHSTPLRTAAGMISIVSVLVLLWLVWRDHPQSSGQHPVHLLANKPAGWLFAVAVVGIVWPSVRHTQHPNETLVDYGAVQLISADYPTSQRADLPIQLNLQWAVETTPAQILQSTVALRDRNGVLYSAKTSGWPPRFRRAYDSNAWSPGHIVADQPLIIPFAGTPAGEYEFVLTLFDRDTLQPLPIEGTTITQYVLGNMILEPATTQVNFEPRFVNHNLETTQTPQLLGYDIDREQVGIGEQLLLTLYWEGETHETFRPSFALQQAGQVIAPFATQPEVMIQPKGRIQTRHLLHIPNVAGLESGTAEITISPFSEVLFSVGVQVHVPERLFEPPPVAYEVQKRMGRVASLYGLSVAEAGEEMMVTLVWKSAEKTTENYRVFIHLIDEEDRILSQSDADPAQWTRPTTSWLPPEFIIDSHMLPKPQGAYRLRIGMYLPETGERLTDPIEFALDQ